MQKKYTKIFGYMAVIILSYIISYLLLSAYTQGDQTHYHNFYLLINDIPFLAVGPIAVATISSGEPISWFFLWVGSNLDIPKNHWIPFLNVLLIVGVYALLGRFNAPWYVFFLIFTNFYLVVLITAAERLKISYIILTFAFLAREKLRFLLILLSPLAHFQSLFTLLSLFLTHISKDLGRLILRFMVRKRLFLSFGFLLAVFILFFLFFQVEIFAKASTYMTSNRPISGLANILLLTLIALWVTRDRWRMFFAISPIFFAVYLLGGERVNMIAVFVMLGILLTEQRLQHPVIIILLGYFSFKTIPFVYNIYKYGNGFGGSLW
jgi:hypothetical protein